MAPLRDLFAHEARGGHTNAFHIGQSVDDLRARLSIEPNLAVASSFWSIETARATVGYLTMNNLADVIFWACGSLSRTAVEGPVPVNSSVGYAMIRGEETVTRCKSARMVLERDFGHDFHILTAFPIP